METVITVVMVCLIFFDMIAFFEFKHYIKKHEHEQVEQHRRAILARGYCMVGISILIAILGIVLQIYEYLL